MNGNMRGRGVFAGLLLMLALASGSGCDAGARHLSPEEIVAAFTSQNSDENRTFHMDWQGATRSVGNGQPGAFTTRNAGSFDLSGDDYMGEVATGWDEALQSFASSASYARVDGAKFVRYERSDWMPIKHAVDDVSVSMPGFSPLNGLDADDVVYERAKTVEEQRQHVIRVLDPAAAMTRDFDTGGATFIAVPEGSELIVYLDEQGQPVSAEARLEGEFSGHQVRGEVVPPTHYLMSFSYQFSKWGAEIAIAPPI